MLGAEPGARFSGVPRLGGAGDRKGVREQRAADLGGLAGARAMREAYTRLFEPPDEDALGDPVVDPLGAGGGAPWLRTAVPNGCTGSLNVEGS
jgi:hypothetical protein